MGAQGAYDFITDDQRDTLTDTLANALNANVADVRLKITHDDPRRAKRCWREPQDKNVSFSWDRKPTPHLEFRQRTGLGQANLA
jgi:hypothetical protein